MIKGKMESPDVRSISQQLPKGNFLALEEGLFRAHIPIRPGLCPIQGLSPVVIPY
jgi:hypothetical protein